jgi:hypothetical protein
LDGLVTRQRGRFIGAMFDFMSGAHETFPMQSVQADCPDELVFFDPGW